MDCAGWKSGLEWICPLQFQNLANQRVDLIKGDKDLLLGLAFEGDAHNAGMDELVHSMKDLGFRPDLAEAGEILQPPFLLRTQLEESQKLVRLIGELIEDEGEPMPAF